MEKFTQNREHAASPEVLKSPEIVVREEHGLLLCSLLLKAENPQWGEVNTPVAQTTAEHFQTNPLDPQMIETLRALQREGLDEESLYNLALTYQHPERASTFFSMAAKDKPHLQNPELAYQQLLPVFASIDQVFSGSSLSTQFAAEMDRDIEERTAGLEKARARIQKMLDFFRPDPATANIQRVIFVPTDPLTTKNSGRAFPVTPGEIIVMSHIDNELNQDHEFSHGFINPIVEKLSEQLTEKQKDKIAQLASPKLLQDYGDGYFSLLCEELIRTYTELVASGEQPHTFEDFEARIDGVTDTDFEQNLARNEAFRGRCAELGITTVSDLKQKARIYYEQFEKNQLRDLIFALYQDYQSRSDTNQNFEQFLLAELPSRLSAF